MRRPALSTPHSAKCTLPATKRSLVDRPASSSPNVKPKAKRNKEEENRGKQISVDDIYALIQDMKVYMQIMKYQMIEEKVDEQLDKIHQRHKIILFI